MRRKAERRWTVMLVPHGSGASRAVEVSQTVVKTLAGFGSALALLFLVLGGAALSRGINITHSRAVELENRLLADEIQRLRERMVGLRAHPLLHLARPHEGIDVSAKMGAEIEAPAAGIVTDVKWEEGYGNMLTIDHGYGLVTRYAHCSKILVARGSRVKRGQKVALVGSTGLSTGPHLHYEVWVNGKPVDPVKYVLPDAIVD